MRSGRRPGELELRGDIIGRIFEDDKERIAFGLDLITTVRGDRRSHEGVVQGD